MPVEIVIHAQLGDPKSVGPIGLPRAPSLDFTVSVPEPRR